MIEPSTITIQQLAERWHFEPTQIIETAMDKQIGLYFRLGNCAIADLPNPKPGNKLQMRGYQGYLRADKTTLESILNDGEASNVQEAYLPDGQWVYIKLPPNEVAPTVSGVVIPIRIATPLTIRIEGLCVFMDEVKAHEKAPQVPTMGMAPRPATTTKVTKESATERNRRRYQMCVDAGFSMPDNDYAVLPHGIKDVAKKEGISRQALSKSVKAHIATLKRVTETAT